MTATAQGFEKVGNVLRRVVDSRQLRPGVDAQFVDPEEEQALTTDIQAQLADLPTAITDDATYRKAKESLPILKRAEDKVVSFFREIKDAANKAHKAITKKESEQLTPITQARARLGSLIYGYEQEEDRKRREREREAARVEQERRQAEALEQAAAMSHDEPEMAEQVIEQAIAAPAPVVSLPSTRAAVAGVSMAENWQFCYEGASTGEKWKDLTSEQRERLLRLLPREVLCPDEAVIGKLVKALKSGTKIPGVRAYDAGSVRVRG